METQGAVAEGTATVQAQERTSAAPLAQVDKVINHHVLATMGVGLVPLPLIDLVALFGIQVNMTRKLAKLYGIPFSHDRAKHLIASVLGSALPVSLGIPLVSLVRAIPLIGWTTSAVTFPIIGGASTYAIGKIFVQHFESGGTFLDFKPAAVKAHFKKLFKDGQQVVTDMKKEADQASKKPAAETTKAGEAKKN